MENRIIEYVDYILYVPDKIADNSNIWKLLKFITKSIKKGENDGK